MGCDIQAVRLDELAHVHLVHGIAGVPSGLKL